MYVIKMMVVVVCCKNDGCGCSCMLSKWLLLLWLCVIKMVIVVVYCKNDGCGCRDENWGFLTEYDSKVRLFSLAIFSPPSRLTFIVTLGWYSDQTTIGKSNRRPTEVHSYTSQNSKL